MRSTSAPALERHSRQARRRTHRRTALAVSGLAIALLGTVTAASVAPLSAANADASSSSFGSFALASSTTQIAEIAIPVDEDTTVQPALDAADTAIVAAAQITADITESGLDVGTDETTVDTSDLGAAVENLAGALALMPAVAPTLVDEVETLTITVEARTTALRSALDAAVKKKAAEEAAAKKAAEEAAAKKAAEEAAAKKAAEEAAARASSSSSSSSVPALATAAPGTTAAQAQAIAQSMMASYGWGSDQFSCLVSLWNRESGWNYQAYNASSGAYGIPQALPGSKMSTAGADWQTNAATQIRWGLGYISGRYGSPCGAWSHSESVGWY